MGGGINARKDPFQNQDEEWAKSIKRQEEMRKDGKEDELIDWDEKIKEHRERFREEEREIEERLTKASKKNESWELM